MSDEPYSPIPSKPTALDLFTGIKRSLLAQTQLPEDAAELVTFWTISTWFPDARIVLPCLVITEPAYDAMDVLNALSPFCLRPMRLAEFRRSDLTVLRWRTSLVSVPNCLVPAFDGWDRE
jgi:hypothetical protein